MPYIKQEERKEIEDWGELHHLIDYLKKTTKNGQEKSGNVVYVIYRIIKEIFGEGNFEVRSNALKVLESAKLEYYRRIMGPYEEEAILRNGDV